MSNLGRLIRTTKQECSICEKGKMELRGNEKKSMVKGETITEEILYLLCNKCGSEEEYVDKKMNKKNKHRELKEVINDNFDKKRKGVKRFSP